MATMLCERVANEDDEEEEEKKMNLFNKRLCYNSPSFFLNFFFSVLLRILFRLRKKCFV